MPPTLTELITLGAELSGRGLIIGSGGNLSQRVGDAIFVTRSGAQLDALAPDDFVSVSLAGAPDPALPRPSVETPMHLAAYHARPDARVIVHCHPTHAIAWAMQQRDLPAVTPDFAIYLGASVPTLPFLLPGSEELATAVAHALIDHPALLLGNHGILITGETVAQARKRTLYIEETARICLLAQAAGALRLLAPAEIAAILAAYGRK